MAWYTSKALWSFVGGVGASVLGAAIAKAPKTRKLAVSAVAAGMNAKQACDENLQSLKEDAEDVAAEARRQAQLDAAAADMRARIEARIREEVEAEMAAEAKTAEEAASEAK